MAGGTHRKALRFERYERCLDDVNVDLAEAPCDPLGSVVGRMVPQTPEHPTYQYGAHRAGEDSPADPSADRAAGSRSAGLPSDLRGGP